jgi:hypothetical protein
MAPISRACRRSIRPRLSEGGTDGGLVLNDAAKTQSGSCWRWRSMDRNFAMSFFAPWLESLPRTRGLRRVWERAPRWRRWYRLCFAKIVARRDHQSRDRSHGRNLLLIGRLLGPRRRVVHSLTTRRNRGSLVLVNDARALRRYGSPRSIARPERASGRRACFAVSGRHPYSRRD